MTGTAVSLCVGATGAGNPQPAGSMVLSSGTAPHPTLVGVEMDPAPYILANTSPCPLS